jgi:hypothetical protein
MVGSTYRLQIEKEDNVSCQFRYVWLDSLLPAMVKKKDSVSHQSLDLFRYCWIHLPTAIVNEGNVSRQST